MDRAAQYRGVLPPGKVAGGPGALGARHGDRAAHRAAVRLLQPVREALAVEFVPALGQHGDGLASDELVQAHGAHRIERDATSADPRTRGAVVGNRGW